MMINDRSKVWIAMLSGVPTKWEFKDGKYYVTTEPCAVVDINGQLTVVSMADKRKE